MVGLLLAGWAIILNQPNAVSTRLRSVVVNIGASFLKIGNVFPSVRSRSALSAENDQLKADNNQLRIDLSRHAEVARENAELRRLLQMTGEPPGRKLIGARVIGRDVSNWWKTIQINAGSQQGVREDAAVINAEGLVGRVTSVTGGESRVVLMVDPNCKVSALIQESREPGVVTGADSAFAVNPICQMTFVQRAARVSAGQHVITSGLGGVFPKGIPVGVVADARLNAQTGMYLDVDVKPSVDFHRLEHVMVVVTP
jgi:rod shape-determining protein MreC